MTTVRETVSTTTEHLLRAWAEDLAAWRIPEPILSAVEESPWVLPEEVFTRRTEHYLAEPGGPSYERAMEALGPGGGSVLDIGAGGGSASLPLAARTTGLTVVDSSRPLLDDLVRRAAPLGLTPAAVCGTWPDVAAEVPEADVVLCHHVIYNVPDLEPFVTALTRHARRRVVAEITVRHPLTELNPYWKRFHGLERPEGPTAEQVIETLQALGLQVTAERWTRPALAEYKSFATLVDVTRRRLCLPPDRRDDVADALRDAGVSDESPPDLGSSGRDLVTLWWPGSARRSAG
ncbi:class I SAM-dependent methyltransferase [Nonomuraea sp. SYSU D8015]|uniref:class I SAM-dependent methyltransferase n=1 Tax=Nonomuraea sp. SYSU D8015 TaxID=2593644 RepID=UPI001660E1FF|nr:methyltransferase domain-containing protein [Nonomuraea sp. SYSU D8015]